MIIFFTRFRRTAQNVRLKRDVKWEYGIGFSKANNPHGDVDYILDSEMKRVPHKQMYEWVPLMDHGKIEVEGLDPFKTP